MARKLRSADNFPEEGFPLRIMRCTADRPPVSGAASVPLHSHEFHELVVVLSGSGRHVTTSDEYPLETGDVFLIRGAEAHAYADTEKLRYVNILFDPQALRLPRRDLKRIPGYHVLFKVEPKLRRDHRLRGCLKLATGQLAETSRLIALVEAEVAERRPGYRFMAVTHLMQMIGYLSRCHSRSEEPARRPLLKVGEVLSHVERHYGDRITVDELCEIADMSESSLARTFHSVVGGPPMDYVIRVRGGKAAGLLRQDGMRVTDVALRCGFSDSNYFSRQFRRVMGHSPREHRQLRGS